MLMRSFNQFVQTSPLLVDHAIKLRLLADPTVRWWNTSSKKRLAQQGPSNLNITVSTICNAKCVFCSYRKEIVPRELMKYEMYVEIIDRWLKDFPQIKVLVLTPVQGDPFIDQGIIEKIRYAKEKGFYVIINTNGILLSDYIEDLIKLKLDELAISLPSLQRYVYERIFGVDRLKEVEKNIQEFLNANRAAGFPINFRVDFRNSFEPASDILRSYKYEQLLKTPAKKGEVFINFQSWYDDWIGTVSKEELAEIGITPVKVLQTRKPCKGLLSFHVMPSDRKIRLCGCRVSKVFDSMIIADLDEGFKVAFERSKKIKEDFYKGIRPEQCQKCGTYHAA